MADKKDLFFEVMTPLGFRVRVTHAYWELIVTIKHPVMAGREEDVKKTLNNRTKSVRVNQIKMSIYFTKQNMKSAGIVLMKDRAGKVIGFEKLNFTAQRTDAVRVAFETLSV